MRRVDTDVLIVGAGPTGLSAATLLADFGVSAITINQYPGTAHTPRAHITNIRTIEMFRDMGIDKEIAEVGDELSYLCNNVMVESLSGNELARYMSYGNGANRLTDYAEASPCKPLNVPQHVMEPVLLKAAQRRGADIRFSNKLVHLEQTQDEVRARIQDRVTEEEYVVHAKYVIGADGGRSVVAEQLGVRFEGEAGLRDMVNVWMDVDLGKYTHYRPGVIYSIFKPSEKGWIGLGAFVCVRPWSDWIFSSPGTADIPEAELLKRIRDSVGDADVQIKIKNVSGWQVNHLYATRYKEGRVFLAGDAAHRHPPSGGLGTNTSAQDVYNLAWKLAYVLRGKAGLPLLDTYHDERMPVGKFVVERAIRSLYNQDGVGTALSFQDQRANRGCTSARYIFSSDPEALELRGALAKAVKAQDYRSNALGVELGQRYSSTAVVDDGRPFPDDGKDRELYYQPSTHPGAFIPHAWIEHKTARLSTVDVVGKGRFGLIIGIGGDLWAKAAVELAHELSIDLPTHAIGHRCEYDDVYGDWTRLRAVGDTGAVLVRPDRYIAWRTESLPGNPKDALRSVLRRVLSR